jgi:hypothetical protein
MLSFTNARHAITHATALGYMCVGWQQNRSVWVIYHAAMGAPAGVQPEMLCLRTGLLPIPLSIEGELIVSRLGS